MPARHESPNWATTSDAALATPANGRRVHTSMSDSLRHLTPGVSSDLSADEASPVEPLLSARAAHILAEPLESPSLWTQITAKLGFGPPRTLPPQSGLYTILPLSDSRLQPQRTILLMGTLAVLALGVVVGVFLLVPRGVTVGEVRFTPRDWRRNATEKSYALTLGLELPVNNPNYYQARIEGDLSVLFYSKVAGKASLSQRVVAARSYDEVLSITVDASNVPQDYAVTVLEECKLLPRQLIFFFRARLTATSFMQREELPTINTYFTVDCTNSNSASPSPWSMPPGQLEEQGRPASALQGADATPRGPHRLRATGAG